MLRSSAAVLLSALCVAGCGSGGNVNAKPATLAPVTGSVKVGGKPGQNVLVTLVPSGTTKGLGGYAMTDATGNFTIRHQSQQDGVEPGDYFAVFSLYLKPDGSPLPPNTSPVQENAYQAIPSPWNSPGTESPRQKVIVAKEGRKDLSFDIPLAKAGKR